ncbi:MAG: YidC/Oxa1 family membrane protein insertase [Syntrophothermus sp.]
MSLLREVMVASLKFFYQFTGSYGWAIILLTVAIRLILYPLFATQTKTAAVMKELQPKLAELQAKYKSKPEEYQKKMMELYKEHKINPLGGCLPALIQLPFLWALFQVLGSFQFGQERFLGLWILTKPDPYYILPILAALTTYIQMAMTTTDPSQRAMTMIMPIFIGWMSIKFASGLAIYWVVSNIFSIGQQYITNRQMAVRQEGGKAK